MKTLFGTLIICIIVATGAKAIGKTTETMEKHNQQINQALAMIEE